MAAGTAVIFESVTDPDLIDYAIYNLTSSRTTLCLSVKAGPSKKVRGDIGTIWHIPASSHCIMLEIKVVLWCQEVDKHGSQY